jgi:nonsense-mediated mRNA decay protein 3
MEHTHGFANVVCCVCSTNIEPNPSNMCVACLRNNVDITEGINRSMMIYSCRSCGRFLCPPWQNVALESKELLAACLRKIPGLSKLRVVDAVWIWTEPHSMRLKIKITVQKEVMGGAILQQAAVVDFMIKNQQCKNCEASYAQGVWHAVVQVRQRVTHKRTFFLLEQIMLKHHAHSDCINIVTFRDGMDFYFKDKGQAVRFIDFLESHVPLKQKYARKLVSADFRDNHGDFKHNYMVELVPICKDDLISIPKSLARKCADINPLCLVKSIAAGLHVLDPMTGEKHEISSEKYWRDEFASLNTSRELIQYMILEIEPIMREQRVSAKHRGNNRRIHMADVTVARMSDLGANDKQFRTITHLGHILRVGDTAQGYDLTSSCWAQEEGADLLSRGDIPDVVLVRKDYTHKSRGKQRKWELKQLESDDHTNYSKTPREEKAMEADYESFLQEIEGDKDFRSNVNLYNKAKATAQGKKAALVAREAELAAQAEAEEKGDNMEDGSEGSDWETDDNESDEEAIKLDELLDGLEVNAEALKEEEANLNADGGAAILTADQVQKQVQFEYRDESTGNFDEANYDPEDFSMGAPSPDNKATSKAKRGKKGRLSK